MVAFPDSAPGRAPRGIVLGAGEPPGRTGVLLINLGTPDSPSVRDVGRYLAEFLSDPRVLDIPAVARFALLYGAILPFRSFSSSRAYAKIWSERGSPLRMHGEALRDSVQKELGDAYVVELGMRYQNPSLSSALERLCAADVARVVLVPLFPQYAASSTGSALEAAYRTLGARWNVLPTTTIPPFYAEPRFVGAVAEVARDPLAEFRPDHVLLSYHGLPERQIRKSDDSGQWCFSSADCCARMQAANRHCYRAQCYATSRELARELELEADAYSVSFQSRLGRDPWIHPYTDERLPELARAGVRRLAVICPSFVADCLETVEEIGMRADEQWRALGGEALLQVPCVNHHPAWSRGCAELVREAARTTWGER